MTGIENAKYDLTEAAFSLNTAIELLASIGRDAPDQEIAEVICALRQLKSGLDQSCERLGHLHEKEKH